MNTLNPQTSIIYTSFEETIGKREGKETLKTSFHTSLKNSPFCHFLFVVIQKAQFFPYSFLDTHSIPLSHFTGALSPFYILLSTNNLLPKGPSLSSMKCQHHLPRELYYLLKKKKQEHSIDQRERHLTPKTPFLFCYFFFINKNRYYR